MNMTIREILWQMGQPSLSALALKLYHGCAGHLVRLGASEPACVLLLSRDFEWQRGPSGQRRAFWGRFMAWGEALVSAHGAWWMQLAHDRTQWKALDSAFIMDKLWPMNVDFTHEPWETEVAVRHYAASFVRIFAGITAPVLPANTQVMILCPCDTTVRVRNGGTAPYPRNLLARLAQSIYVLRDVLGMRPVMEIDYRKLHAMISGCWRG
jgi:hypothetical protein